ncbi:hypothetical protein G9A89_020287 [Geosiphon pyriformis]|nr:hypothetical protein G9A89_020287 [Geosiphon pyriformis]
MTSNLGRDALLEVIKSKEEKSENQEFTYQNPILEKSEIETPNFQTHQNPNNTNPKLINQKNLPPKIIINQQPIELIAELIQQPQQPLQQPPQQQQQVIAPMAYAPIAKLEKFTGEKNNAQVWLNNIIKAITANNWDNARAL